MISLYKLYKLLNLELMPKLNWEFFFGKNIMKPVKDLLYGYVPEGYDQEKEDALVQERLAWLRQHTVVYKGSEIKGEIEGVRSECE